MFNRKQLQRLDHSVTLAQSDLMLLKNRCRHLSEQMNSLLSHLGLDIVKSPSKSHVISTTAGELTPDHKELLIRCRSVLKEACSCGMLRHKHTNDKTLVMIDAEFLIEHINELFPDSKQ